jgi:hypothetical protein
MLLFAFLQVQKRNFIENIIPIIISLKTVLEKNKIPALRELMNYLRVNELAFLDCVALPPPPPHPPSQTHYSGSSTSVDRQ